MGLLPSSFSQGCEVEYLAVAVNVVQVTVVEWSTDEAKLLPPNFVLSEFRPDFMLLTGTCSSHGMHPKDAFWRRKLLSSEPGDIQHHQESRGETLKEGLVPAMFGNSALRFMPNVFLQLFGQSLR